jgi:hypothetical protein
VPPYTINYTRNGVAQTPIPGYTSGTDINTLILTTGTYTYALTSVTDLNNCSVESLGTPIVITVGSTPTAALLSGNNDVCFGSESFIRIDITGGAPPFNIKWSLNGVPQTDISGYTSGTDRSIGFLAVNNYSVTIQEIKDFCDADVPVGDLPGAYTFKVDPIPNAGGTTNNTPTICNTGTTDIVLQSTVANTTFDWTVSSTPAVSWVAGRAPVDGSIPVGNGLSIAQQLEHTGTVPVSVTYKITPTGPGATVCPGAFVERTVVVEPTPAAAISNNSQTLCNVTSLTGMTITNTRTHSGTPTFDLAITALVGDLADITAGGNGKTPVTGGSYPYTISGTLTNNSSAAITIRYTVTPKLGTCTAGTPVTATVIVEPSPAAAISNNTQTLCYGASLTGMVITSAATHSGTPTFDLAITALVGDLADITAGGNGKTPVTGGSYPYTISGTLTNNSSAAITIRYTVTPKLGTCTAGTPVTATVIVEPSPAAAISNNSQTLCNVTSLTGMTITNTRTHNGTPTFDLAITALVGDLADITAGGNGKTPVTGGSYPYTISGTLTNNSSAAITIRYTVTPKLGTCTAGTPVTATVIVEPRPTATISNNSQQLCSGSALTAMEIESTSTHTKTKTFDLAIVATTGNLTNITATGNAKTPVTGGSYPYTISGNLTNTSANTIIIEYRVTPKLDGCANGTQVAATVTVYPTPVLSTTLTPTAVCSNTAFTYTANSATPGTTYTWNRPEVTNITPATNSGVGANISETLRNLTGAPIAVTYEITLTANGCSNTQNVVVNIKPEPVIDPDQGPSICSGESLNHEIVLLNLPLGSGTTYTWPEPTLSAGLTGGTERLFASSANMTDTFTNTSGGAETATYYVTPYYNGCQGETVAIIITIGSEPVLDPNLNDEVCSALPIGLLLKVATGSVPATSYDVASVTVAGGLVPGGSNVPQAAADGVDADYLSNDVFTNETGVDKTIVYRVRPLFGATCIGEWVNITITIKPQPLLLIGQTAEVCSSVPVNKQIVLVPANTPGGTLFNWNVPVMSAGPSQGTAGVDVAASDLLHITDVLQNYGTGTITATYTIIPVSDFGCYGTPRDVVVTVKPEPLAPVVTGRDTLCMGGPPEVYTVPLNLTSASFTWTVPAAVGTKLFDANTNAIILTPASSAGEGYITVTETNTFGCTSTAGNYNVVVLAPPTAVLVDGDNVVCALESTTYSVPYTPGSTYIWTLPAGAALIGDPSAHQVLVTFGTTGGEIRVSETNAGGCVTNHLPLTVTVNPLPVATISNSGTICMEDTHPVSVSFTGTAPWRFTYAINGVSQPEVTGVLTSPYTIDANTAGSYTIVSVTDGNGCTGTGVGNAVVSFFPKPTAIISGTTAICNGGSAVLTVSLTGTAPFTFTWTDGTTPVTVTHPSPLYTVTVSPTTTTSYTLVDLTAGNGCAGLVSGSADITVNQQPVLAFTVTNVDCFGNSTGAIVMTVTGAATYNVVWTGPDGYTSTDTDISGLKAGQYNVTVTSGDGCIATGMQTVTQPTALSLVNTGNIALLCNGDLSGMGSFTTSGGTAPYTFTIVNTTGGTVVEASPVVNFSGAGAGTITVGVTDGNGCYAESTVTITQPTALSLTGTPSLSIEGSHNINCFGGATGSIALNVSGGVAPYTYTWTTIGGSGLTAGAANQTGLTEGTYTVLVRDANGCEIGDSWTLSQPTALSVTAVTDDALIGTCIGSDAQLTATPAGGVPGIPGYTYSWTPAAGLSATNIANPVAKPSSTTTYTVVVTDANGCTATSNVLVAVAPPLSATASATDLTIGTCITSTSTLNVAASGGEAPYTYLWDNETTLTPASGDTQNPVAKPAATTTYTVTVTDANNCQTTAQVTITVLPELTVSITATDLLIGTCESSKSNLTATVAGGEAPYTYAWDNGATLSASNIFNPVAKPAISTIYTVTVTDGNGCQARRT